jgi:hypothetical protein
MGRAFLWSGTVDRRPVAVRGLPPYDAELRALPSYEDSPSRRDPYKPGRPFPQAAGWYQRYAANNTAVATTTDLEERLGFDTSIPELVLGVFSDAQFYHDVNVTSSAGETRRVVSIREADPWSGIAHRYAWSQDSRALLISGCGHLASDAAEAPVDLCLVYVVASDQFFRLEPCR